MAFAQQLDTARIKIFESEFNTASQAAEYYKAATILKKLIALGARDSSSYYGIAVMYGLAGDTELGRIYLDTAIARGWVFNSDGGIVESLLKIGRTLSIDSSLQLGAREAMTKKPSPHSNREIHRMFEEDQIDRFMAMRLDRSAQEEFLMRLSHIDKEHRDKVRVDVSKNKLKTKDDLYEAGSIFSHGVDSMDFLLAIKLAKSAIRLGDSSAKILLAHSEDKYLISIGKPQKYGTQFYRDTTGEFKSYPVDHRTTDGEREKMGLPPLKILKKEVEAGYGKE